ncbi:hypothetical protein NQ318_011712 [Aromia moschata]|uniref:Gustatory receptor n=1 Tax=Aromia moschata TaxID=1265417 RepID=A0AAV8XPG8_9CUCU|nr:hypothetical protein NQ318_011712 [Aromia moschata]
MLTAVIVCFVSWSDAGYVFTDLVTHIFYLGALATLILYLRLATSWSKLILLWCRMDKVMNNVYGYPKGLDKRLRIVSATFLILSTTDYSLSVLNRYTNLKTKLGKGYSMQKYYEETFPQLYRSVPFNIFSDFSQVHGTLLWALNDLFIILMSIPLAFEFHLKGHNFWIEIREDYDRLSILCKELDSHISYIVLLSFSLNTFFLLVQLYHSLETVTGFIGRFYFVFSFVYLIIKVVSVSLYAAWINDESIGLASILNSVPSASYNVEIRRLLLQISFDKVALTGCRMFKITRGIILSIAGAIVTYL